MGAGDCDVPAVDRSLSEALPERRILLLLSAFLMAMPVVMEAGMILACLVVVTALAVASLGVLGRLRDSKLGLRGTDASRALIVAMGTVGAAMDALLVLRVDSPPAAWVALTVVVALLALVTTFAAARASRWAGVCAVALMVVTGIAVHQMVPMIDVLVLHEHAAAALLAGHDPYAITFPDPYPPALDALFYGPGLTGHGRILAGYPYPPVSLLMATAGHALGDARFVAAAGLGVCVWLLRRQASEGEARAAATALVLLPGSFTMVWNGWTDVHVLLLLVLVVIAALREWRATPYVIGALIVSKQYMIVAVPLLVLLLPVARRTPSGVRGFALRAAIAAATLTVPWILWSPSAFWDSVVRLQFRQPFRVDSISLLVEVVNATGWPPPATYGIIPLAAGLLTATAMAWRAPRTPAAFAAALSVTLTVTFLLSSQGHSNYYFLPAAGLLVACVTWPAPGFTSRETGEKVGETPIDTERTNHIGVFRPLS